MKKTRYIAIVSVVLAIAFLLVAFSGCSSEEITDVPKTTDNYRTYYQIFPYSFSDSNGDGVGDINGIIEKLDYIESLNFDGIWLTPVHESPTYHKYDVKDYRSIDKQFGTLEDYDRLVEECHKRGMTILLDLVFNHTSSEIDWFERCYQAHVSPRQSNIKYLNYYDFRQKTSSMPSGWESKGSLMYECQFWSGMPDLNLQNVLDEPEGYLATELKDIMKFWLVDHKVDGFRLDAVTSYFSTDSEKNTEFLRWLNDTAKALKPNCYIVGEGSWGVPNENKSYQASGVDSFFAFQHGYSGSGTISFATRLEHAVYLADIDKSNKDLVDGGMPALFVANHDTPRAWGILQGGNRVSDMKMGYGFMAMCCGSTFWYYGDEVGMNVLVKTGSDNINDEDRRQPMPWGKDDTHTCVPVKGSIAADGSMDAKKYPLGTVATNLNDKDSLLNYIKRANAVRRAFPQIARNYGEQVYLSEDDTFAIIKKGTGSDAIYIAVNLSHDYETKFDLSTIGGKFKLVATLSVDKTPSLGGTNLTMPVQTFAILQQG